MKQVGRYLSRRPAFPANNIEAIHSERGSKMGMTNGEHLGLGVDCGGTYTDAVIYDLDRGEVLASAKFPTSHHDLTRCIDGVLEGLPQGLLQRARLTCLSTTLATNAIVEGRGGKACLILLGYEAAASVSPFGSRVIRLEGGHDVRGEETEALDEDGLRAAISENDAWADAFAVSGYFSVRNPAHEIRAREIIAEETGKPIVCGHELSMQLDAPRRATTAAINARLIPLITTLISSVQHILESRNIQCPLMVVRGDGTLMGSDLALERPVETILSGPAASVVGALTLSGRREGVVIDIGGTTTDIAWVSDGLPPINGEGAVVGGLATRVEAIDIRTIGLGGDSWIKLTRDGGMELGPRRVLPMAMLPQSGTVLEWLERVRVSRSRWSVPDMMTFWVEAEDGQVNASAAASRELAHQLEQGPLSHLELKSCDLGPEASLQLMNMERRGDVLRASLTPTDIFNASGESAVGNAAFSRAAVEAASSLIGTSPAELMQKVKQEARESIVRQVLVFLLGLDGRDRTLLEKWMQGGAGRGVQLALKLETPILAAGAPAALFLTPVASFLSCECVVPPHVEVANAVGAVAGVVSHREEVILRRQPDETFRAFASDGRYDYPQLDTATRAAVEKASGLAMSAARLAGAGEIEIDEHVEDFTISDSSGDAVVLERKVTVRAYGRPRMQS
jgi:N-methylhydantoinase A/oxoprolinase/acetone carboxylase beta subunit